MMIDYLFGVPSNALEVEHGIFLFLSYTGNVINRFHTGTGKIRLKQNIRQSLTD